MLRAGFLLAVWGGLAVAGFCADKAQRIELFDTDLEAFKANWREQGFPLIAPTEYRVRTEGEGTVVVGRSEGANRGLLRECKIEQPMQARLSWRWRVNRGLDGRVSERTRGGDDFAARVFVVFETSIIPTRTRAINYVWAAKEAVGTVFPSPYTKRVAHVVVRSDVAVESRREWFSETRDVLADYESFFGEPATVISAVAIMVDADNTNQKAESEFAGLILEINSTDEISCP